MFVGANQQPFESHAHAEGGKKR